MVTDNNSRYWTYSNYLIALSRLIEKEYPSEESLAKTVGSLSGFQSIRHRAEVNTDEVAKLLRLSWFTELLLWETSNYPDLLPYSNPWAMIQCYYAVHPSIRAYFLSTGRNVENAHNVILRQINVDLINCKDRFPSPWRCVASGDPHVSPFPLSNTPCSASIDLKNALVSPFKGDPCQHYGLFLKTTRARQLERSAKEWKKRNHKVRLPRGENQNIIRQLPPTSIFDTLYRIRTRSNYQDIDSFTYSTATTTDSLNLNQAVCKVVFFTLFVLEMMIARSVGKTAFTKIADDFMSTPLGEPAEKTLRNRWIEIYKYC